MTIKVRGVNVPDGLSCPRCEERASLEATVPGNYIGHDVTYPSGVRLYAGFKRFPDGYRPRFEHRLVRYRDPVRREWGCAYCSHDLYAVPVAGKREPVKPAVFKCELCGEGPFANPRGHQRGVVCGQMRPEWSAKQAGLAPTIFEPSYFGMSTEHVMCLRQERSQKRIRKTAWGRRAKQTSQSQAKEWVMKELRFVPAWANVVYRLADAASGEIFPYVEGLSYEERRRVNAPRGDNQQAYRRAMMTRARDDQAWREALLAVEQVGGSEAAVASLVAERACEVVEPLYSNLQAVAS